MKLKYSAEKCIAIIFIGIIFVFGAFTTTAVVDNFMQEKPVVSDSDQLEAMYNDNILFKNDLVSYNGGFHLLLHQNVVRDADPSNMIIKTGDGSITSVMWKLDVEPRAEAVIDFNKFLDKQDIPLLYVMAPYKVIEGYTKLPTGVTDFSNIDADTFCSYLNKSTVNYLDLRQDIIKDKLDLKNLFFRTDHHWQTKTAFWAFAKVANVMAEQYGFEINKDNLKLDQYTVSSYKKVFLGSEGRRVGQLYAGLDDYDFIKPNFPTDLSVTIYKGDGTTRVQEGDFTKAIVYKTLLDMTKPVSSNRYASYFGGDYPKVIIKNNNVKNGKVLIIKDSFSLPFAAFLSTVTEEVCMIDLRYYTNKTLCQYVKQYQPDMVMILYNPSSLNTQGMYNFGTE